MLMANGVYVMGGTLWSWSMYFFVLFFLSTRYDTFSDCIFCFHLISSIATFAFVAHHFLTLTRSAFVLSPDLSVCDVVCNLCSHATVQMKESRFVTNLSFAFLLILFCLWLRRYVSVCDQTLLSLFSLGRNDAKCEAQIIIPLKNQQTNLN